MDRKGDILLLLVILGCWTIVFECHGQQLHPYEVIYEVILLADLEYYWLACGNTLLIWQRDNENTFTEYQHTIKTYQGREGEEGGGHWTVNKLYWYPKFYINMTYNYLGNFC